MKKIAQVLMTVLALSTLGVGCNESSSTSPKETPNTQVTGQNQSSGANAAPEVAAGPSNELLSEFVKNLLSLPPELMSEFQAEPACLQFSKRLSDLKNRKFENASGTLTQAITEDNCFGGTFYAQFTDDLTFVDFKSEKGDHEIDGGLQIKFVADVGYIHFYISTNQLSYGDSPVEINNLRISLPQTSGSKAICDEDVVTINGRQCTVAADCNSCQF